MKKYAILALAALMVAAFAIPASALENQFGGAWDTRFQTQKYYDGLDRTDPGGVDDTQQNVETRTRLYYTAKINDNLKFVNKFELDTTWGVAGTYGAPGADPIVKDSEFCGRERELCGNRAVPIAESPPRSHKQRGMKSSTNLFFIEIPMSFR